MALTEKKRKFAHAVVELGELAAAYRASYNTENMQPVTVQKRASELNKDGEVAGLIAELRTKASKKHDVTVASLLRELEEARVVALSCETPQTSAAVSATMGKAKLCGLDKQLIELSGEVNGKIELTTAQRKMLDKVLDDEC